mmetsp:Transcript_12302/g.18879  ORF Transcript_12302/g.18879 Transcript_12302/m.18879 type:complete len:210 (-) Transcript_12302:638-1267(-)
MNESNTHFHYYIFFDDHSDEGYCEDNGHHLRNGPYGGHHDDRLVRDFDTGAHNAMILWLGGVLSLGLDRGIHSHVLILSTTSWTMVFEIFARSQGRNACYGPDPQHSKDDHDAHVLYRSLKPWMHYRSLKPWKNGCDLNCAHRLGIDHANDRHIFHDFHILVILSDNARIYDVARSILPMIVDNIVVDGQTPHTQLLLLQLFAFQLAAG